MRRLFRWRTTLHSVDADGSAVGVVDGSGGAQISGDLAGAIVGVGDGCCSGGVLGPVYMAADMMGLPQDVDVMVLVVIVVPIADVIIGSAMMVVVGVVIAAAAAGDGWQLVDGLPSGIGDEMLVVDNPGGGLPAPVVLLLLMVVLGGPGFDV
ncbi:hypothetical protein PV326_001260, partial [Microctonus aethiopoides]